jgi:hypothetical protein
MRKNALFSIILLMLLIGLSLNLFPKDSDTIEGEWEVIPGGTGRGGGGD